MFVVGLLQALALEPVGQRKVGSSSTFIRGPGANFNGQRSAAFGPSNNRGSVFLGFNRGNNGKVGGGLGLLPRPVSNFANNRANTATTFNRNGAFKPGSRASQVVRPFPGVPVRNAVFNAPRPLPVVQRSSFRQNPGVVRKF